MRINKRLKTVILSGALATAILLSATSHADPPSVSTAPSPAVAFHAIVSTSAFWQNQDFTFGNGQNGEWPVPNAGSDRSLSGFDARNTRVWMDVTGMSLADGWSGSAHLEADFFGGFNGTGSYSAQQETPRLRQAFMKVSNGDQSFTIGQQFDLLFPIDAAPVSITHIAFPLGFGTGLIGWRFPGVVYSQNLGQPTANSMNWRLDVGAFSGSWNGPGLTTNFGTAANVNFRPQIEARLHAQEGDWLGFLVGHYSTLDLSGTSGSAPTPIANQITSSAVELGTAWHPGDWSLVAEAYTGKGLGQVWGALTQFGDISEHGGYVQGGYKFTRNWGLYASYATGRPNANDVIAWIGQGSNGLLKNEQAAVDLIFNQGPFSVGADLLRSRLDSTTAATAPAALTTFGNQFSVGATYSF